MRLKALGIFCTCRDYSNSIMIINNQIQKCPYAWELGVCLRQFGHNQCIKHTAQRRNLSLYYKHICLNLIIVILAMIVSLTHAHTNTHTPSHAATQTERCSASGPLVELCTGAVHWSGGGEGREIDTTEKAKVEKKSKSKRRAWKW